MWNNKKRLQIGQWVRRVQDTEQNKLIIIEKTNKNYNEETFHNTNAKISDLLLLKYLCLFEKQQHWKCTAEFKHTEIALPTLKHENWLLDTCTVQMFKLTKQRIQIQE